MFPGGSHQCWRTLSQERVWAVEMHQVPESHKLFGIDIDASLTSPELLSTHIDLHADILDDLEHVL